MRGGAVTPGGVKGGDIDSVQRIRVSGAEHGFHIQPLFFRCRRQPAHKAGFSGAGAALDDVQKAGFSGREAVIQGIKAPAGVGSQKIAHVHGQTSFFLHTVYAAATAHDMERKGKKAVSGKNLCNRYKKWTFATDKLAETQRERGLAIGSA